LEKFLQTSEITLTKKSEIQQALTFIRNSTNFTPKIGLILGSGLGDFGSQISSSTIIQSGTIPNYPSSSVPGHAGKLIFGFLRNETSQSLPLLVFQGRVHYYESGSLDLVTFPVILAHKLGVRYLIVTNAAGGINTRFTIGDLMLIQDIINLTSLSIPHLSSKIKYHQNYFNLRLKRTVINIASLQGIPIQNGTYCWLKGPTYETPAEIRMLKNIGVDAVGMSSVPEIVTAKMLGMQIVGISLISNLAAGISPNKLSHSEISEAANSVKDRFAQLMKSLILSIK
jgi:purine-nucleoside phosphorylase